MAFVHWSDAYRELGGRMVHLDWTRRPKSEEASEYVVEPVEGCLYKVYRRGDSSRTYSVLLEGAMGQCSCLAFETRYRALAVPCKHLQAVYGYEFRKA